MQTDPLTDPQSAKSTAETALQQAMMTFWTRGAEATTYADLVAATGLSRKALYGLWPDKDHLLQAALQQYRDQVLTRALHPLDHGGAAGLEVFWFGLAAATAQPDWRGCLLMRTGAGPVGQSAAVARLFHAHAERLRLALIKAIHRAQAEARVSAAIDPDQAAISAVGLVIASNLLSAMPQHKALAQELIGAAARGCGVQG